MDLSLKALVRKFLSSDFSDGRNDLAMNPRGDLCVAPALPLKTEIVRMGGTFTAVIPAGSAFTYVAGLPTTRAELVLYNGETGDGKSYVIDSVFMFGITSQAAAQPASLVVQNVPVVATVPTDAPTVLITSRSGLTAYPGKAKRALANTAAGQIADKWEVVGSVQSPMTTNLGAALYADLFGGFIVKPGGVFALAGVAGTAAGTAIIGVTWHEVKLPAS